MNASVTVLVDDVPGLREYVIGWMGLDPWAGSVSSEWDNGESYGDVVPLHTGAGLLAAMTFLLAYEAGTEIAVVFGELAQGGNAHECRIVLRTWAP